MNLHAYAPEALCEFLDVIKNLPVKMHKVTCSHRVGLTIPKSLVVPLRDTAEDLGLMFEIVKTRKQVQVLIKSFDDLMD